MSAPLSIARGRLPRVAYRCSRQIIRSFASTSSVARQGPGTGENFNQANDPQGRKLTPNVSETDAKQVDTQGIGDKPLQESVEVGEERRELQAPNRPSVWSRNQMPRDLAMSGPRFEQTIMETQVRCVMSAPRTLADDYSLDRMLR